MDTALGGFAAISAFNSNGSHGGSFLLRFNCLFTGRGLCFPCDARGEVNLDALSERARGNLQRAQSGVGRDFSVPQVVPAY
jgi:hypothetical protein